MQASSDLLSWKSQTRWFSINSPFWLCSNWSKSHLACIPSNSSHCNAFHSFNINRSAFQNAFYRIFKVVFSLAWKDRGIILLSDTSYIIKAWCTVFVHRTPTTPLSLKYKKCFIPWEWPSMSVMMHHWKPSRRKTTVSQSTSLHHLLCMDSFFVFFTYCCTCALYCCCFFKIFRVCVYIYIQYIRNIC